MFPVVNEEGLEETDSVKDEKITEDEVLAYKVVCIVWNSLVQNGRKPSKYLGRTALRHAYPLILERVREGELVNDRSLLQAVDMDDIIDFFEEFGSLLFMSDTSLDEDDDSRLLWDMDGGKSELTRRRQRREETKIPEAKENGDINECDT